jgi:outer membrane beta-barrel protein
VRSGGVLVVTSSSASDEAARRSERIGGRRGQHASGGALIAAALLLASQVAWAQTAEEEAGDISEIERADRGPLKERIRPVSGQLLLRNKRFEVSPLLMLSMKDAFFSKYIIGGLFMYHPTETWAFGARAGYSLISVSGAAQICTQGANALARGCRPPKVSELSGRAPGYIQMLATLDAQWAPVYGKLALFAEQFLHFDAYVVGGPAFVLYQGPDPDKTWTVGGHVGVGMRFFINRWITARFELRDLIYGESLAGQSSKVLRNQLLFEVGASFFFPTIGGES